MSSIPIATESDPQSPRVEPTPGWRRWIPWAVGAAVILAVVAAVIGVRGGWDEVEPRGLPKVAPGELVEMKPHAVRVIEWAVSDEIEVGSLEYEEDADAWLAIHVEMTTSVDTSTRIQSASIQPIGVRLARTSPTSVRLDAGGNLYRLEPDLPIDVVLLYPVKSEDVPDELTVQLATLNYVRSNLSEEMVWLEEQPLAQVSVPRNDAFVEPLIEEDL